MKKIFEEEEDLPEVFLDHLNQEETRLKETKERLTYISTEYERLKDLYEVLQLIDTLKQEGILIGNNRVKISRLLYRVQDQNITMLKTLKKKLSVHLPEQYNKITIS